MGSELMRLWVLSKGSKVIWACAVGPGSPRRIRDIYVHNIQASGRLVSRGGYLMNLAMNFLERMK